MLKPNTLVVRVLGTERVRPVVHRPRLEGDPDPKEDNCHNDPAEGEGLKPVEPLLVVSQGECEQKAISAQAPTPVVIPTQFSGCAPRFREAWRAQDI